MDNMTDLGFQLVKVLISLGVVVALLYATVFTLKRLGQWSKKQGTNDLIQILAQQPVGFKHFLLLVKIQEQRFLLGLSPQGIHLLSPISDESRGAPSDGESQP